jgi:transposase
MDEQMGTMEGKSVKRRRRYSAEFKQRVLAECAEPGVSVAGVALSHGINANLVQTWRREAREASAPRSLSPPPPASPPSEAAFIPISGLKMRSPREYRRQLSEQRQDRSMDQAFTCA